MKKKRADARHRSINLPSEEQEYEFDKVQDEVFSFRGNRQSFPSEYENITEYEQLKSDVKYKGQVVHQAATEFIIEQDNINKL